MRKRFLEMSHADRTLEMFCKWIREAIRKFGEEQK